MRLISIDETGISAKEATAVVVGVIVKADLQWRTVESLFRQLPEEPTVATLQLFVCHRTFADMKAVKEYFLLKAPTSEKLVEMVNAAIRENKQVFGHPLIVSSGGTAVYFQAMAFYGVDSI